MDKQDLLKYCRFYNGNLETSRTSGNFYIWEKRWVDAEYECRKTREMTGFLADCCDCYRRAGLLDFEATDGIPLSLKAVLYISFLKGEGYDINEFKALYYKWRDGIARD